MKNLLHEYIRQILKEAAVSDVSNLALHISDYQGHVCMVLYNAKIVKNIFDEYKSSYTQEVYPKNLKDLSDEEKKKYYEKHLARKEKIAAMRDHEKNTKHFVISNGTWSSDIEKATWIHSQILEQDGILAFCELKEPTIKKAGNKYAKICLGAYEVWRIGAEKGYGPLMFELAMSFAATKKAPIIIDRDEVSDAAAKMIAQFDTGRTDVIKFPQSLSKYGKDIGFEGGSEKTLQKRTLDPEADYKVNQNGDLVDAEFTEEERFLQARRWRDKDPTRQFVDSLDKAYFYEGRISDIQKLTSIDGEFDSGHSEIRNAAIEFFLRKNPKGFQEKF